MTIFPGLTQHVVVGMSMRESGLLRRRRPCPKSSARATRRRLDMSHYVRMLRGRPTPFSQGPQPRENAVQKAKNKVLNHGISTLFCAQERCPVEASLVVFGACPSPANCKIRAPGPLAHLCPSTPTIRTKEFRPSE